MDCSELRRFLHAYIDLEFDEREQIEFELHLAQCTRCREEVNYFRAQRRTLRKTLPCEIAPMQLKALIHTTLDNEVRIQRGWFSLSMATVGAFMLALGTLLWSPTVNNSFVAEHSVNNSFVAEHPRGNLPGPSIQKVSMEPQTNPLDEQQKSRMLATKQYLRKIFQSAKKFHAQDQQNRISLERSVGSDPILQRVGMSNETPTISLRECDLPGHFHKSGQNDKHPWCKMAKRNNQNPLTNAILHQYPTSLLHQQPTSHSFRKH